MPQPYVEYVVIELRVAAHLDSHIVLAPPFEKARRVHSSMVSDSMQSRAVSHAIAQQSKHCTRRGECCTHRILWMATSKNSSSTSAVSVRPHGVCQYSHCDTTDRTLPSTWSLPLASIASDNTYVPSSHSNPQQNCAWCGVQPATARFARPRKNLICQVTTSSSVLVCCDLHCPTAVVLPSMQLPMQRGKIVGAWLSQGCSAKPVTPGWVELAIGEGSTVAWTSVMTLPHGCGLASDQTPWLLAGWTRC